MRKLTITLVLLFLVVNLYSQEVKFEVVGKVDRITNSRQITLQIEGKTFSSSIDNNGIFSFKGSVNEAVEAMIMTDSSDYAYLCVESGTINLKLSEINRKERTYLQVVDLEGPDDSYLYFAKNTMIKRCM